MKNIAFISEHASPLALLGGVDSGGQNVYVAELARSLTDRGFTIDIFTRRESADQPETVHWQTGIRVIHITAGPQQVIEKEQLLVYMEEFRDGVISFMRRQSREYELVHAHFFMSALVASGIKKQLGIPYIITFHALGLVRRAHQHEADRFPSERCTLERLVVYDADHLIAECPEDRKDLIRLYGASPKKITIIPCGFNPGEFEPGCRRQARHRLGLPDDEPILLQLGRMVPRKGIDNVIRALGCVRRSGQKARLVVVGGEGPGSPELRRLHEVALMERVGDSVIFAGRQDRDQLKYYYNAADMFITTPWYEPFGITPLEAMACGIPVIGSDTGGIRYSVVHGRTGFLVPPRDPVSLAARINQLIKKPRLMLSMGRAGLRRVNRLFTWDRVAGQMSSVYEGIAAIRRRPQSSLTFRSLPPQIYYPTHNLHPI